MALVFADILSRGERGVMTRSAGITAALLLATTAISFGSSLLYARVLGPHGFGLYAYVTAWTTLLTIPATMGLPSYLMREGAGRPGALRELRRWADMRVLVCGGVILAILAAAYWLPMAGRARLLFLIAAPLPLLAALGQVRQGLLRALHFVATSQWPLAFGPLILVLTMFVLWLVRGTLHPWEVMTAAVAATFLVFIVNQVQLNRVTRQRSGGDRPRPSLRAALPFMVMGMLFLINDRADIILLGSLRGPHDVGIYAIVARGAAFVAFVVTTVDMVIAPRVATFYRTGERQALQRLLTASARRTLLLSLPLAILFLVAAVQLLHFFYGNAYIEGAMALRILTVGYLFMLVAGFTTVTVNMTGHERFTLYSAGVTVGLNILLNFLLIPDFGMNGSAIATSASLLVFNGLQWFWVRRLIGFRPTVLGL